MDTAKAAALGGPWRLTTILLLRAFGGQGSVPCLAVTASYVEYVSSPGGFGHPVMARILQPAVDATGTPLSHRLLVSRGFGALLGALIGAIGSQAFSRRPRPFRRK